MIDGDSPSLQGSFRIRKGEACRRARQAARPLRACASPSSQSQRSPLWGEERTADRLPADQLQLALEDIEAALAKNEAVEQKKEPRLPRTGTRKRGALPRHLTRIHETAAPPNTNCPCCNAPVHMIGEETSERLDVVPAQYRVIVTHRPKFACRACEKVVQENAPEHLIKSGLPTEAMVASVLVAKYGWHLPLYRQAKMLSMQGIDIDRSTLAFWVGYAAAELAPLYELKQRLLSSSRLAVDETPVPVLNPGRGRTKTGYFWSMARDDRPFGGTDPPAVAYTYAPGRGAVHLHTLLKDYRGIVQCDRLRVVQAAARRCGHARLLLGARQARLLRDRQERQRSHCYPGTLAHCRALQDRRDHPRQERRSSTRRPPRAIRAALRRAQTLPRKTARPRLGQGSYRAGHPLCAQALARLDPLPR
jgi:transposase